MPWSIIVVYILYSSGMVVQGLRYEFHYFHFVYPILFRTIIYEKQQPIEMKVLEKAIVSESKAES